MYAALPMTQASNASGGPAFSIGVNVTSRSWRSSVTAIRSAIPFVLPWRVA